MFPHFLIQNLNGPQVAQSTPVLFIILAHFVLFMGIFLENLKVIIFKSVLTLILILPIETFSFGANPYACGTSCLAQQNIWGSYPQWSYPPVYYYPYTINPYSFYANPYSYYPQIPSWNSFYGIGNDSTLPRVIR